MLYRPISILILSVFIGCADGETATPPPDDMGTATIPSVALAEPTHTVTRALNTPTSTVDPSLLLPDLQTLPPSDLEIETTRTGERRLRFTNSILNAGPGILELLGDSDPERGVTVVTQHIYHVDGTYDEHPAGEFAFHPEHDHWHLGNFAKYEVWSLMPDRALDEVVGLTDKVSYCIRDNERFDMPGASLEAEHEECDQQIQGMSVGWVDIYEFDTPGQIVDITGLADGVYTLRSTVDPSDQLREADDTNNAGAAFFELSGAEVRILDSDSVERP